MKLDPNDFQCVKKLAVPPEKEGGISIGDYDDYLNIDQMVEGLAEELSHRLGQTLNTLCGLTSSTQLLPSPQIPAEAWDALMAAQEATEQQSGAAVPPIILDTNKLWEDKIKTLEKELQHAIDTNAENKSYLAAELAAKKLSFTTLQIQQKKIDIENQQFIADVKAEKAAQDAYWATQQKITVPTGAAMDKFNLGVYSPDAAAKVQASKNAAVSATDAVKIYYDTQFLKNLKAQFPVSNISQGLKKKQVLADDTWDDESENGQLKFLQKIGFMSNLNVSPQSRIMRSTGVKRMMHRLLCDKCKESIPAEADWVDLHKADQPEIVEFCKAHRHVEAKEEEGRKFRG